MDKFKDKVSMYVRSALKKRGLTQTALAEYMKMSRQLISYKIKKGSFTMPEFSLVAKFLGENLPESFENVSKRRRRK